MQPHDIRILLIEDQVELAELLRDYLRHEAYTVDTRHSGEGAVEAIRANPPHLLLLDLMLPGVDGLSICREVRRFSDLPVIMVTARVEEIDRLLGLEIGADDYICKPVRPREVVARVKAVLRRSLRANDATPADEGLLLDEEGYRAWLRGRPLDLTPLEFRLLQCLARTPGRVFSRDQLLDVIHDSARSVTDRAVDTHIKNLRRKISAASPADENPIRSVYGVGYKLELE